MAPLILEYRGYLEKKFDSYHNAESIQNSYDKVYFVSEGFHSINELDKNSIQLQIATIPNDKESLIYYIKLRELNSKTSLIKKYEKEYPLFKEAYDVLGPKGISSCNYSKTKIKRKLIAYSEINVNKVIGNIFKKIGKDKFISKRELKLNIIDEYKKLNIDIKKVGFTNKKIIELCTKYKFSEKQIRIDKKPTHGYVIKPSIFKYLMGLASYISN